MTTLCVVQFLLLCGVVGGQELAAFRQLDMSPDDMYSLEQYTNLTLDEILTAANGGMNVSIQKMVGPNGMFLAELDMLLTEEQFRNMYHPPEYGDIKTMPYFEQKRKKRKAVRRIDLRWPNGEVPFYLTPGHFKAKERYLIRVAMREWEKYTCVRFREATSDDDNYIRFQNGDGCNSQLGMVGGGQLLNLDQNGCRWKGLYLHEIGHALGLVHEHQLPNRDEFIEILYNNVAPSMRIWFNKYSTQEVNQYDVPYEYSSVMHYGVTAFAKDGKSQTIRAKDHSKEETIGKVWRKELSFSDVKAVNRMYECSGVCPRSVRCADGGIVDQNCHCICPDGTSECQENIRPRKPKAETCLNEYDSWKCYVWSTQGECKLNTKFMNRYCQKACGLCGSAGTNAEGNHVATWAWQWLGIFTNLFPKNWTVEECHNKHSNEKCDSWAKNGDCVVNEVWMKVNCKSTCGMCSNNNTLATKNCGNVHTNTSQCEIWARKGECMVNREWMYNNCRGACRLCEQDMHPDTDTPLRDETDDSQNDDPQGCRDKHNTRECLKWASSGECTRNPDWMVPNCRKSCNRCNDGSCKNLYDDKKCTLWAQDGECMKNHRWMPKNCKKACGDCDDSTTDEEIEEDNNDRGNDEDIQDTDDEDTSEGCRNYHNDKDCDTWSKSGHCDINPGYMKTNCKRSCGVCASTREDDGSRDGRDDHDEDIANDDGRGHQDDEIDTDSKDDDMNTKEEEEEEKEEEIDTGQREDTETEVTTRPPLACVDDHTSCEAWAKVGYCRNNAGYSLRACRKACKNCNSVCIDEHILCPMWAKSNQCDSNPGYMLRFCHKSCRVC